MEVNSFKRVSLLFVFLATYWFAVACSSNTPAGIDWGKGITPDSSVDQTPIDVNVPNPIRTSDPRYDPDAPPPTIKDPLMGSAWREFTKAPIQNRPGERSVDAYLAVILQFDVANSYPCRYTPSCGGTTDTRCNIFASDVMNAMGVPLPTKGDLGVGHGSAKTTDPMPANAPDTHAWLETQQVGWKKIDPNNPDDWAKLMAHVAAGKPALASHPEHIAVVRPDQPGGLDVGDIGGLNIAQAGAYNSNNTFVHTAFDDRVVDIYIHE
jgi:hypothetical protein